MAKVFPPCGLYRTSEAIGSIPAGRLVFFHDHGDPGPGVYLPESWSQNRAKFASGGTTIQSEAQAASLQPLLAEGLYRVEESFTCCDKNCRTFEADTLVQLGYNGNAQPILFLPEWGPAGLSFPESGQRVDDLRLARLGFLLVADTHRSAHRSYH